MAVLWVAPLSVTPSSCGLWVENTRQWAGRGAPGLLGKALFPKLAFQSGIHQIFELHQQFLIAADGHRGI